MQKFIDMTIKPVLIIGGLGTAAAGLDAFLPAVCGRKHTEDDVHPRVHDLRAALGHHGLPDGRLHGRGRLHRGLARAHFALWHDRKSLYGLSGLNQSGPGFFRWICCPGRDGFSYHGLVRAVFHFTEAQCADVIGQSEQSWKDYTVQLNYRYNRNYSQ